MAAALYLNRIKWEVNWLRPTAKVITQGVQQEGVLLQWPSVFRALQQTDITKGGRYQMNPPFCCSCVLSMNMVIIMPAKHQHISIGVVRT